VFLVLVSTVAWVAENPPMIDEFSSISVLGPTMTASSYFPGNSTTVVRNETVLWNVQVFNHMGTLQLFLVRIKLANFTIYGPNATTNSPSEGFRLLDVYRAVKYDETWSLPIQWSIMDNPSSSGTTTIQTMMINNSTVSGIGVSAAGGTNLRIVIELYSYDTEANGFVFSFTSNGVLESVFDQIWFNTG
jgi:hypothetical protein